MNIFDLLKLGKKKSKNQNQNTETTLREKKLVFKFESR